MSSVQVDNNLLPAYNVVVDKNTDNYDIQVMRIDFGAGSAESRLTTANPLPVAIISGASGETAYALKLDESASPITYIGQAVPGTVGSAALWSIKRMDETSGLVITWASGSAAFNQVWDDRASLIYS